MKRIICVAGLALVMCACEKKQEAANEQNVKTEGVSIRVNTAQIQPHYFKKRLRVQGNIQAIDRAEVAARASGTLVKIYVDEGDSVCKDSMLFQIDNETLLNQRDVIEKETELSRVNVKMSEADLAIAQVQYKKAKLDFKRSERLLNADVSDVSSHEQSEVNLDIKASTVAKTHEALEYYKIKVMEMESAVRSINKSIDDTQGKAPFNGVITKKHKEENEFAGTGSTIFSVENPDKLEIACQISAVYYSVLNPGTMLEVSFNGMPLARAAITYKAKSIDAVSRTFEIRAALPEKTPCSTGTLCDVDIILAEREGLGIAQDAILFRKGGKYIVYTEENKRAKSVEALPGITTDGITELLNAAALKGKKIIVSGQYFVSDGSPVDILNAKQEQ